MKRKYANEAEVLVWIGKYRADINNIREKAAETGLLADSLRGTMESHRIPKLRADVETMFNEIEWREGRIVTLGQILAEMQTLKMPFIEDVEDESVPGRLSKWINEDKQCQSKCCNCGGIFNVDEGSTDLSGEFMCKRCLIL